jgi:hypothetical protein
MGCGLLVFEGFEIRFVMKQPWAEAGLPVLRHRAFLFGKRLAEARTRKAPGSAAPLCMDALTSNLSLLPLVLVELPVSSVFRFLLVETKCSLSLSVNGVAGVSHLTDSAIYNDQTKI